MSLIKCSECGNNVSDKAQSCPSCGCPIDIITKTLTEQQIDEANEVELIQCPECKFAVEKNEESCHECGYPFEVHSSENVNQVPSQTNEIKPKPRPPVGTYDIPTGLYMLTGILAFPLGTGLSIGFNMRAKSLIKNGEYNAAIKHIKMSKVMCWILVVPCIIALLFLLFVAGKIA